MKKILLMAAGAFILTASAFAQTKPINDSAMNKHRRSNVQNVSRQYSKELQLTEAQKEQIKRQNQSFQEQRKAVHNDASLTAEQKKTKLQEIQQTSRDQYQSVLTPQQKEKMKTSRGNKMIEKKNGTHPMKGKRKYAAKNMDHLKLTPEQQARMDKQKARTRKRQRQ